MFKKGNLKFKDLLAEEVSRQYRLKIGEATLFRYLQEPHADEPVNLSAFARNFDVSRRSVYNWLNKLIELDLVERKKYQIAERPNAIKKETMSKTRK